jgi:hypothetical protein
LKGLRSGVEKWVKRSTGLEGILKFEVIGIGILKVGLKGSTGFAGIGSS